MASREIPAYLDEDEDKQYADPARAGTRVPQLAAVLNGDDNERTAELRADAERLDCVVSEYVPTAAARRLYDFARHHPAIVAAQAPTLVDRLGTESEDIRRRVAFAIMHAATEPEPFVKYAPDLIALLDDNDPVVRGTAAFALGEIAAIAPDDVVPAVDALVALVSDPDSRVDATEAIVRIGDERPQAITVAAQPVAHHFQALSAIAADPEPSDIRFRVAVLEVIARIASVAPATIDDVSDPLRRAMQSPQSDIRWQAAATISALIAESPNRFAPLEPDLQTGFDDEEPHVRRSVALAYLRIVLNAPAAINDPTAIAEHLRTLNTEFDDLPSNNLEQALQTLDAMEESH